MQKFLRFLMLAALFLPFAMQAQNTLTVADGTSTNSYVPIYGLWADAYLRCQTIYPASELDAAATTTGMNGGTITSLTYYLSSPAAEAWTGTWEVKLMEVTATTLSAFLDMTNATTVYTGSLDGTQSPLTITFATPYTYNGGNLLIEVSQTTSGNYKSASFYGVSATGASWQGYNSSAWSSITGSAQNFIPKTTFTFTGGSTITCRPVQNLTIDATQTTSNSLTLTWIDTLNSGASYTVYDLSNNDVIESGITPNTYTVNNLAANTVYSFGVEANCSATDASVMITTSGRTACAALSGLPFNEGFESVPSGSYQMPFCWERYTSAFTTSTTYPYSYSGGAHAGSRSLYYYGTTGSSYPDTMIAIMPELDVTLYPMNGNRVTFWAKMGSTSYNKNVYVYTMTNPADITTLTLVDSVLINSTDHTLYSVSLTNANANDPYVAFMVLKGDGTIYIDDVTLEELPSCFEVSNVTVSNITSNTVTINWVDANNSGASYTIYNMADTTSFGTTSNTTYLVENLDANTVYTFGVQANCATGDGTIMTVSARTACDSEELPFTENFDATLSNDHCWRGASELVSNVFAGTPLTTSSITGWDYKSSESNGIPAGHYCVNIYGSNCKYWLITPNIDLTTVSSPLLSFDAAFTKYSGTALADGDITDDKFFVIVSTDGGQTWDSTNVILFNLASLSSLSYLPQYVDLSSYVGNTIKIAFYAESTVSGGDNNLHIDNLSITESTGGICLPVISLTASNITENGATLSWNGSADSYTIIDMSDLSEVATTSNTTYDITDLDAMTQYSYGVIANCSSSSSDTSTVTFSTACSSLTLPYTETFEANSATINCWTNQGQSNWTIGTGDYSTATGAYEGSHNARIVHSSTGNVTKFISPVLDDVTNGLKLDFAYVMRAWSSDIDELRVYSRADAESAWQQVAEYTNAAETWTVETVIIPGTVYQIAFEYTDSYGYGVGIDSVVFSNMTGDYCFAPTNLTVSGITTNEATLTWGGDANNYNVYVITATDTTLVENVTDNTISLDNLTTMTTYTYGVTAVCTSDESDMITVTFSTACAAVELPYTETFESTSGTRNCWNLVASGNIGGSTGMGFVTVNNREVLQFSSYSSADDYNQYGFSPIMDISSSATNLSVTVVYGTRTSDYLYFGYVTDTDTIWDSTPYNTNSTASSYNWETATFIIPATATQFAVHYYGSFAYYAWIDSVTITEMTGEYCFPVTNLTVGSTTTNSVALSWNDGNNTGATYTIYNMADNSVIATNVNATSYVVTGLTTATDYTFGVAANCSATSEADIVTVDAVTACDDITVLPYYEGFENDLGCWTTINGSSDGQPWYTYNCAGVSTVNPHGGAYVASSWSWNNNAMHANAWLISPKFVLPSTTDSISFSWFDITSPTYPDKYSVVLSTTTNDTAAFTTVLRAYGAPTGTWTMQTVDLTQYAGQSVYIAFHHLDYDENYLFIDDIALYQGAYVPAAPDTLTVTFAVNDATMGTTVPAPGTYQYISGDTVSFHPEAFTGYHFTNWVIEAGGSVDTLSSNYVSVYFLANSFMSYGSVTLTALFEADAPTTDSLTIHLSINDPTLGTINPVPGTYVVALNDSLVLSATPAAGANFDGWKISVGTQTIGTIPLNPFTIPVNSNNIAFGELNVVAMFSDSTSVPDSITVIVNTADATMGTTNPAPGTYHYAVGSQSFLAAIPNPGYHNLYWIEEFAIAGMVEYDTLYADTVNLTVLPIMAGVTLSITAYFEANEPGDFYNVSVTSANTSMGTVTSTASGSVAEGTEVTATATALEGYRFVNWTDAAGVVVSTANPYTFTVTADVTLIANFELVDAIEDITLAQSINLMPNPADNYIELRINSSVNVKEAVIYNAFGQMIQTVVLTDNHARIDLSNMASGMYFVRVNGNNVTATKKFIKK